jgi:hypothetical protein
MDVLWAVDPGRRSQTRFALGYFLSGFQPFPVRRLLRFNELHETLQLRLSAEFKRLADEELRAVLTLLAGPGVV